MEDINVSSSRGFEQVYDTMNNSIVTANPTILIILTIIIVFYFIVFSYLGYSPTPEINNNTLTPSGMKVIEIIMWGLLIFLVLINGLQYLFQVDIKTAIKNIFTEKPTIDVKIKQPTRMPDIERDSGIDNLGRINKEVFNIPGNEYTHDQAKALCKAFEGELASYNQIENAYKSGAEWCNYGWSKDQMAYFPTQKSTWHKLQKIKGHENDCGRPGINGGYMKNPNIRFGVNCYGIKPKITKEEQEIMNNATPYPLTEEEVSMNKLVQYYKKRVSKILLSPFNYNNWNKI